MITNHTHINKDQLWKNDKFCLLYIEKDIIRHAKIYAQLDLMPVCLPSVDIEHGSACFTTRMPGYLKREKKISLNIFSPNKCSKNKDEPLDEYDICAGFPDKTGAYQSYQEEINFGAALFCYKSADSTIPILTGLASRKDLSPKNDKPGIFTNIYKIKSEIQAQLGNFFSFFWKEIKKIFSSFMDKLDKLY